MKYTYGGIYVDGPKKGKSFRFKASFRTVLADPMLGGDLESFEFNTFAVIALVVRP